jgi:hypothetical protein
MTLTLTLPKNIEASRVAAEIADRAARYRLCSEELDAKARAGIEAHLDSQARVAAGGEKAVFEMAAARPVSEHSARIAPRGDAIAPPASAAPEPAPASATPPSEEKAFCTTCGEEIALDDSFCSACGERVES